MNHALHHEGAHRHLTILTGASRGMGLAMARLILQRPQPQYLLTLSRELPDPLQTLAVTHGQRLECWSQDLADPVPAAERLATWLETSAPAGGGLPAWASVTLINNAGALSAIGPLGSGSSQDISQALRVGLEAPLLLTAALLRATPGWPARLAGAVKVLNISSGLGRRAMAGSATYCAAKAGLDLFSAAVALEQPTAAARGMGTVRVVSLAPGVIDTQMQAELRGADPAGFPDRERFLGLQQHGLLDSAEQAAAKVLAWLDRPDFGQPVIADVRQ
jgi:benzil reductase ((S)-benzoin forming)